MKHVLKLEGVSFHRFCEKQTVCMNYCYFTFSHDLSIALYIFFYPLANFTKTITNHYELKIDWGKTQ